MNTRKLASVAKVVDATTGTKISRSFELSSLVSSVGESVMSQVSFVRTDVRDMLEQIQFVDKAGDSSVRTFYDGNVGVYQREFYFPNGTSSKYILRNLNQHDVLLRLYIVEPKEATAITPVTAFTEGLDSVTGGVNPQAQPHVYLTDSPIFNDMYKIVKTKKTVLAPGHECTVRHTTAPYTYDPRLFDVLPTEMQVNPDWGSHFLVIQMMGRLVRNDDSTTQFAIGPGSIYIQHQFTSKLTYNAGADVVHLQLVPAIQSVFVTALARQTAKPGVQDESFIIAP